MSEPLIIDRIYKERNSKFRVWHKEQKRMIYVGSQNNDTSIVFEEDGWYVIDHFTGSPQIIADSSNSILMRYTGRKDKNEIKIFERDIVLFTVWWFDGKVERENNLTGEIVYSDDLMSFQLKGVRNKDWEKYTGHENDTEYLTPFSELLFDDADFEVIDTGTVFEKEELINHKEEK